MNLVNRYLLTFYFLSSILIFGNLPTLNDVSQISIDTLKLQQKDTSYINQLLDKAINFRHKNSDSLYFYTNIALNLSKQSNFLEGEAKAYFNLGAYYSGNGKRDEAIKKFLFSYNYSKTYENYSLALNSLNLMALQYNRKGDHASALQFCLEGIELADSTNNLTFLARFNGNVAALYTSLNIDEQAIFYYDKAKKVQKDLGDEVSLSKTMCNMASLIINQGDFDKALNYLNYSEEIFEKENVLDWQAYAYGLKGKLYSAKEEYKTAIIWYEKSEKIHRNLDDQHQESIMFIKMSQAYLGLNQDKKALFYVEKALEISKKLEYLKGLKDCYKILYSLSRRKEDFKTALGFHEKHQELLQTLNINESKKSVALVKAQNEYEKNKREFLLDKERLIAKQRLYVFLTIGILFFSITIILLVRRNLKLYKSFNKTLLKQQSSLIRSEEKLTVANQAKTQLFSIIGHDLKGPILSFQGLLSLYSKENSISKEVASILPRFKTSIDSIAFTLENLLHWAQTQSNGFTANPKIIDINDVILRNKAFLHEQALGKSIELINQVNTNTLVFADANQIEIVIRNLLSNAIKFTKDRGVILIGAVDKLTHWKIYIKDNGVGMNSKTSQQIFDNNYKNSTYGTKEEKGVGIGLSLCKQMIKINKGEIWVESELSKGTVFYFTLPKNKGAIN